MVSTQVKKLRLELRKGQKGWLTMHFETGWTDTKMDQVYYKEAALIICYTCAVWDYSFIY